MFLYMLSSKWPSHLFCTRHEYSRCLFGVALTFFIFLPPRIRRFVCFSYFDFSPVHMFFISSLSRQSPHKSCSSFGIRKISTGVTCYRSVESLIPTYPPFMTQTIGYRRATSTRTSPLSYMIQNPYLGGSIRSSPA